MTDENKRRKTLNVPAFELPPEDVEKDFRSSPEWRVLRIQAEFINGFNFLADLHNTVTFFGSARFPEDNHWYKEARKLGKILTDNGYNVVTGGGPGIMEAGNRGASEGGGKGDSIGLNIQLPFEQRMNPYVDKGIGFHYFFVRKVILSFSAQAYVYFPGGFGTLDEFSELVTLIQTKKVSSDIPMVLVGKEFWQPFLNWVKTIMLNGHHTISEKDLNIFALVDTAEEAYKLIAKAPQRTEFG